MKHLFSLLLIALLAAPTAFGQGKGFSLGAHLQSASVTIDPGSIGDQEASGFGLGIVADYGFTNLISAFVNIDAAGIEFDDDGGDGTMAHVDLGARFHFRAQEKLFPYVQVGFTGVAISSEEDDEEMTLSGGGLNLGGGVHYFLSPKLALDASLVFTGGQFTTLEIDGEENDDLEWDMSTFRIKAGIMYFFNRQ